MSDIVALLERAATQPTREPDVDGPYRRARRRHRAVAIGSAVLFVAVVVSGVLLFVRDDSRGRVEISQTPTTTFTKYFDPIHGLSARIPDGWHTARSSLTPSLTAPREVLAAATAPLAPATQPDTRRGFCDDQTPVAGVDAVGSTGAFVWITDGIATVTPKPGSVATLPWRSNCSLPNGLRQQVANFELDGHGVGVALVLGRESRPEVIAQAYALIDSLHFDQRSDWHSSHDAANDFDIAIPPGFMRSHGVLEPWLYSPHEILSLATVPLAPLPGSPDVNQAACPSEIPKVAVDGIGSTGAFLGIYEWIRGQGLYTTEPRPAHASELQWREGCPLPNGTTVSIATLRDGNRDFTVAIVLGRLAQDARTRLYEVLDSFTPKT
jgi:hypothetical protein